MVSNSIVDAILEFAVILIIALASYLVIESKRLILTAFYAALAETLVYCMWQSSHRGTTDDLEQLYFVFAWCGANFILSAFSVVLSRMKVLKSKKVSFFFGMNGVLCLLLFIFCGMQISRSKTDRQSIFAVNTTNNYITWKKIDNVSDR